MLRILSAFSRARVISFKTAHGAGHGATNYLAKGKGEQGVV